MPKVRVLLDCLTVVFGEEMVHLVIDASRLERASRRPRLHDKGLRAKHLTIPFMPRRAEPHKGSIWVHLTYPDGTHKDVAYLWPDDLRPLGEVCERVFGQRCLSWLQANARPIDAQWLRQRGYMLVFTRDDEFMEWADRHFKQGKGRYRISEQRLQNCVEALWIAEPEILEDEDFVADFPRCLRALSPAEGEVPLSLWRLPWGPNGAGGWYITETDSLLPEFDAGFVAEVLPSLSPRFWDAILTILIELGVPVDYDDLERLIAELKAGRFEHFANRLSSGLEILPSTATRRESSPRVARLGS